MAVRVTILTDGSYDDYRVVGVAVGDVIHGPKYLGKFKEEFEYSYLVARPQTIGNIQKNISMENDVRSRLLKLGFLADGEYGISLGFARWAKSQGAKIEIFETYSEVNL